MRALLDTHTFIWAATGDRRLSNRARAVLEDMANEVYFSAASSVEIGIKAARGGLELPTAPRIFVTEAVRQLYLSELTISVAHGLRLGELPPIHRDPFDRVLVAQAQTEELPILTADPEIAQYDIEVIW